MKKTIFILGLIFCFALVSGTETISDLTLNSPIPLDTKLVATGIYNNTDSDNSVFCKFVTYSHDNNKIVERFTDELTFADGSFYSERLMTEPRYFRDENILTLDYKLTVTCGSASADANFSIEQRQSWENQFFGELFFLKDNSGFLVIGGIIFLIVVVVIGSLVLYVLKRWNSNS